MAPGKRARDSLSADRCGLTQPMRRVTDRRALQAPRLEPIVRQVPAFRQRIDPGIAGRHAFSQRAGAGTVKQSDLRGVATDPRGRKSARGKVLIKLL